MNAHHGLNRRAAVLLWGDQRAVRAFPRPSVKRVVERVVDVDLLSDRIVGVLHVLHEAGIVEPGRISLATDRRQIDEAVVAVAADDSHLDAAAYVTLDPRLIVAAVQVDANLLRFIGGEPSSEIGRVVTRLDADVDDAIGGSNHGCLIVRVRAVDVGSPPQLAIIAVAGVAQSVAPRLEPGRKLH